MGFFELDLSTGAELQPSGEPFDYVAEFSGVIRYIRERDDWVFRVGTLSGRRVHVGLARRAGVTVFDVCDCSSELHAIYAALYDSRQDDLKLSVRTRFGGFGPDFLVLDYVVLHPKCRGRGLGLQAVQRFVDLAGGGCALAVCDICPFDTGPGEGLGLPESWLRRPASRREEKAGRDRLRVYFGQLGFQRIGRTRFYGLPLADLTALEDLV
jgi:hypothetical protein